MRPYLAIIKDSFRAALASHVLYVLLGLITLLLVAIAPFHYREVLDWEIKLGQHVRNPELLVERLVERKDSGKHPEIARIWSLISTDLQEELVATAGSDHFGIHWRRRDHYRYSGGDRLHERGR